VEDYEVAAKFEDSKSSVWEDVSRLAAQHIPDQVRRDLLGQDIQKLFVSSIAGFLELQNLRVKDISIPPRRQESNADSLPQLEPPFNQVPGPNEEPPFNQVTEPNDFEDDFDFISEVDRGDMCSAWRTSYHDSSGGFNRYMGRPARLSQASPVGPASRQAYLLPDTAAPQVNYPGQTRPTIQPTFTVPRLGPITGPHMGTQGFNMSSESLPLYSQANPLPSNPYLSLPSQTASQEDIYSDMYSGGGTGVWENGNGPYDGEEWRNSFF
jgi:hypothetical protein